MLQVLQLNMFERRPLQDLLHDAVATGPLWLANCRWRGPENVGH